MFQRELDPHLNESFFLFGARGTGKSTWLRGRFEPETCLWVDLLDPEVEDKYLRDPKALEREVELLLAEGRPPNWIVIDEVQKAPRLLDLVHRMIETKRMRFALSGSSARKLKRGHANMLGGRAAIFTLHPLTHGELADTFDLESALNFGTLPRTVAGMERATKIRAIRAYCTAYLKEEILVEQLIRKLAPFKNFLEVSAQMNGKVINYEGIARDVGVDNKTVQSYFDILEETYLGLRLPPFHVSIRKAQRRAPKFYWFDGGVARFFSGAIHSPLVKGTSAYGEAFEAFVINELIRHSSYRELDYQFSYLEAHSGGEIDVVLSRGREHIAIEIKSSKEIDRVAVEKLEALARDLPTQGAVPNIYYVSQNPSRQKIGAVQCLPWQELFQKIGSGG